MKINKVLELFNKGDKSKLYKYLQKGIFAKEDKINAIKLIPLNIQQNDNIEYLYLVGVKMNEFIASLILNSISIKLKGIVDNVYTEMIIPPTMFDANNAEQINLINAIAINLNVVYNIPMINFNGTLYEYMNLAMQGSFDEYYKSLPKITKEEYYNIDI